MLGEARRLAQQHARQALATIEEIELTLRGTNAPPLMVRPPDHDRGGDLGGDRARERPLPGEGLPRGQRRPYTGRDGGPTSRPSTLPAAIARA
jgi:hypothetical protein